MIGFKLDAKRQPLRHTKNWNFKPQEIRQAPLPLYHIRSLLPRFPGITLGKTHESIFQRIKSNGCYLQTPHSLSITSVGVFSQILLKND